MSEDGDLSLERLDHDILLCREKVDAGEVPQEELDFLLRLRVDFADATPADWALYNDLRRHLPDADADPVLLVLKGNLLIEQLVRSFVASRLPNPKPIEKLQLSSAQYIALAESLCMQNEKPRILWEHVKELNSIRNKMSHTLGGAELDKRVSNFVTSVCTSQGLSDHTLVRVISRLYGMVKGLCDVSLSDEFKIPR